MSYNPPQSPLPPLPPPPHQLLIYAQQVMNDTLMQSLWLHVFSHYMICVLFLSHQEPVQSVPEGQLPTATPG